MHVFVTVNRLMAVISRMTALTGFHKDSSSYQLESVLKASENYPKSGFPLNP